MKERITICITLLALVVALYIPMHGYAKGLESVTGAGQYTYEATYVLLYGVLPELFAPHM